MSFLTIQEPFLLSKVHKKRYLSAFFILHLFYFSSTNQAPQGTFMESQINRRNSVVNPYQTRCNSHLCPPLERRFIEFGTEVERRSSEGRAEVERRIRRVEEEEEKSNRRARQASNTSQICLRKKLFRQNPTPLHQHPTYRINHQYVTAILNISQPYINPTPTLHHQTCISLSINYLQCLLIFPSSYLYHFYHFSRLFSQVFTNIIS